MMGAKPNSKANSITDISTIIAMAKNVITKRIVIPPRNLQIEL